MSSGRVFQCQGMMLVLKSERSRGFFGAVYVSDCKSGQHHDVKIGSEGHSMYMSI